MECLPTGTGSDNYPQRTCCPMLCRDWVMEWAAMSTGFCQSPVGECAPGLQKASLGEMPSWTVYKSAAGQVSIERKTVCVVWLTQKMQLSDSVRGRGNLHCQVCRVHCDSQALVLFFLPLKTWLLPPASSLYTTCIWIFTALPINPCVLSLTF